MLHVTDRLMNSNFLSQQNSIPYSGNIGEEQSLANVFQTVKIKTVKLGVTVLNMWMQD